MPSLLPSPLRRIAIVGNAPDLTPSGEAIDAADWVVRFNNAAGFGGAAGRRVTHLALVNHGGQMREWLADPGFGERPHVRAAERILFPFGRKPPEENRDGEDGRDWTAEAEGRLRREGRAVEILAEGSRRAATATLLAQGGREGAPPSTGFLVAHHLAGLPETQGAGFDVFGFAFEGWSGHGWAAERRWFEAMARAGRFRLHPLERASASA